MAEVDDDALPEDLPAAVRRRLERAERLEAENRLLREMIRRMLVEKYGPASEKLDDGQLQLLEEEPGVHAGEVEQEAKKPPVSEGAPLDRKRSRYRRGHPGRCPLPDWLPREEHVVPSLPEQCRCPECGGDTGVFSYESTEELAVRPPQFFVRVVKREKRSCRLCPQAGVTTAPPPPKIIPKGLASNELVVEALVAKYRDHLPVYRQCASIALDTGVQLDRATVTGWIMSAGELLRPVQAAMREELIGAGYIQADETTVGVQVSNGRRSNHQGYLFAYGLPKGTVVYDFRMGRARAGPREFLDGFRGTLQTDGYDAYDKTGIPGEVVRTGCWVHARRRFHDMLKIEPENTDALRVVGLIRELYALEDRARERRFDAEARGRMRAEHSLPIAEEIYRAAVDIRSRVLPKSTLGKACTYLLGQWPRLKACLEDGRIELDNNLIENAMRPLALGRKNWIHIGSEAAGPRIAAILSVFETCKRLGIDVREYLLDILPGMGERQTSEVAALTPSAWLAARTSRPQAGRDHGSVTVSA